MATNNDRGMRSLKTSSRAITKLLGQRATTLDTLSGISKVASALGAAFIAIATVADLKVGVYISAGVVFLATVLTLYADQAPSLTLSKARIAIDKALDRQSEYEKTERAYYAELERQSYFQAAKDAVREILEDVATSTVQRDEVFVITRLLTQVRRQLFLAFGFEQSDSHVIGVYKREVAAGGQERLVLKAHLRAIECEISQARVWNSGVGVAGSALALRREVVVADLASAEAQAMYPIPNWKADDLLKYRSIAAVPIGLQIHDGLWGILVATSSIPGHFSQEDASYVQVAQSLAGMISLAVKLVRLKGVTDASSSHR